MHQFGKMGGTRALARGDFVQLQIGPALLTYGVALEKARLALWAPRMRTTPTQCRAAQAIAAN
jgi:hypothetical protein